MLYFLCNTSSTTVNGFIQGGPVDIFSSLLQWQLFLSSLQYLSIFINIINIYQYWNTIALLGSSGPYKGLESFCHIVIRNQLSLKKVVTFGHFMAMLLCFCYIVPHTLFLVSGLWCQASLHHIPYTMYLVPGTQYQMHLIPSAWYHQLIIPFYPSCIWAHCYRSSVLQTRPKPVELIHMHINSLLWNCLLVAQQSTSFYVLYCSHLAIISTTTWLKVNTKFF